MREIEFRGKKMYGEEWIYGLFWNDGHDDYIIVNETPKNGGLYIPVLVPVIAGTVGQYTGLKDRNSVKIFEADILRYRYKHPGDEDILKEEGDGFDDWEKGEVKWGGHYPAFDVYQNIDVESNGLCHLLESGEYWVEVIGNIHDNPELAAGKNSEEKTQ